jgi:UrcA family protein
MSSLQFDARRPAHPVCQHFHAQQEIHMYTIKRILISALFAGLVCAGEAALFAADTSAAELPQSVTVRFADLNLDRPADVAKLYHRIKVAAESTCGARDLELTPWVDPDWTRCVDVAVAQAVARVDRPALSAYHQRRLGFSPAA